MKKELEKQIRLIEDQIDKIEESFGNYPPEEIQIKLDWLDSELRELEKKIMNTKKTKLQSLYSTTCLGYELPSIG